MFRCCFELRDLRPHSTLTLNNPTKPLHHQAPFGFLAKAKIRAPSELGFTGVSFSLTVRVLFVCGGLEGFVGLMWVYEVLIWEP